MSSFLIFIIGALFGGAGMAVRLHRRIDKLAQPKPSRHRRYARRSTGVHLAE